MRYAFRGKSRATQQPISGHIEAPDSESAIDTLADKGIIAVLTVRPDPLPQANPPTTEAILGELVDKMDTLIGHVEKLMARPTGPVRDGVAQRPNGYHPKSAVTQDAALKEILRTNLDLRRSLEKLSPGVSARGRERELAGAGKPQDSSRLRERSARPAAVAARPMER